MKRESVDRGALADHGGDGRGYLSPCYPLSQIVESSYTRAGLNNEEELAMKILAISALAITLVAVLATSAVAQCVMEYEHGPGCGFGNFGDFAYQKNASRTRTHKITSTMRKNGSFFRNDTNIVSAGNRAGVGCTKGDGIDSYTFEIVGCEPQYRKTRSNRNGRLDVQHRR
jgi:hypothetical protein